MKKYLIMMILMVSLAGAATNDARIVTRMINQDPDPAGTGDIIEVRIGIENYGDLATGTYSAEIVPQYPFGIVSGESAVIEVGPFPGNLAGSNMKIVKLKVKVAGDANAGTYDLPVLIYEEGKRDPDEKMLFPIEIESSESAEVIIIDQVELIPGKIAPMKFTINNVGSSPLKDLTFQWENSQDIILPVGSDNTKHIRYIDVEESAELDFNVVASANADPDLYKLDLTLSYSDPATGEDRIIATKAGVYVGGATDFDVAFSGVSGGEYSFSISNIGSVSASSVTVRVPQQQGWTTSGSNSVIIGNLNEGDYTIASFTLAPAGNMSARRLPGGNATRSNAVDLEIIYTDSRGNRNTLEKRVHVTEGQPTISLAGAGAMRQRTNPFAQAWQTGRWVLLAAVIFAGFLVVNRRYRKGKLKDPDYTYGDAVGEMFAKKKRR